MLCFNDRNIERINLILHSFGYPIAEMNVQRKRCVQGAHRFYLLRKKCHPRKLCNVVSDSFSAPSAPTSAEAPLAITAAVGSTECPQKDHGSNWLLAEVLALVDARRSQFLEDLDAIDARDLMTPDSTKWKQVSDHVMHVGFSPCMRDGLACKMKWN